VKAVAFREFGPPSVLRLEDVPEPVAGPGELVIKVHAVSVNRTLDLAVRAGKYAYKPPLPHVLGADPSGVIVALGPGVADRKVGERVVTRIVMGLDARGGHRLLGVHVWGGYAEYVKVSAAATCSIHDHLDFATATSAARHASLAFSQLRSSAKVQKDEWVLVMGAVGALGSAAVQVAKHLGARVIAAAGSDERVQAAMALGADAGVNYRNADFVSEVLRVTDGAGVNVVLENIGDPDLFAKAFSTIGLRGRLVTAGGHGGGTVPLDVKRLYLNQIQIIGTPGDTLADVDAGLRLAASGGFKALIDHVLPLGQAAHAHELVEARSGLGKTILDPTLID
jgi:NADPH2:quinone reductase